MYSATFANDLIKLIFCGTPIINLADNAAATPITNLVLSLHSSDPGAAGVQNTAEVAYTGYQRILVPRLAANWNIVGNVVKPAGRLEFAEMTGGAEVLATWVCIGTAQTGAGKVLLRGRLTPDVQCRLGVIPAIKADTAITFVTSA